MSFLCQVLQIQLCFYLTLVGSLFERETLINSVPREGAVRAYKTFVFSIYILVTYDMNACYVVRALVSSFATTTHLIGLF